MADHRRQYEDDARRSERDMPARAGDDVRSWFGDDEARRRRGHDDRDERSAFGTYRTDDRDYHDHYRNSDRHDRYDRYAAERSSASAASDYSRAARDQRDDYMRWGAQHHEPWREPQHGGEADPVPAWAKRERGGYWRNYEASVGQFAGRGPKGYQRSDDRVRDEICDCMTDDPMLDASEISVDVSQGVVTLTGSVSSRQQKRRAEDVAERISGVRDVTNQLRVTREAGGHNGAADSSRASGAGTTSSQPVSEGTGTPSNSTSRNTA